MFSGAATVRVNRPSTPSFRRIPDGCREKSFRTGAASLGGIIDGAQAADAELTDEEALEVSGLLDQVKGFDGQIKKSLDSQARALSLP